MRSSSSEYKDTGVFQCEDEHIIVDNLNNYNTECLKNSLWQNEDKFACWGGEMFCINY